MIGYFLTFAFGAVFGMMVTALVFADKGGDDDWDEE